MLKRTSARRAATFLAMLGALVMSSGVALMVTAGSANAAAQKVVVCKYVSTPGGAFSHIVIPSKNTLPSGFKGTFPYSWTDAHGQSGAGSIAIRYAHKGEQARNVAKSECVSSVGAISYTEPTCQHPTTVDFAVAGQNKVTISYSGNKVPGGTITVTATAMSPFSFADGSKTFSFPSHTFNDAIDPNGPACGQSEGPLQATAVATPVPPTCAHNVASYSTDGSVGVKSWDESAAPAFGTKITLTAHAATGYVFGDSDTTTVDVTFGSAATDCNQVSPPTTPSVSPPKAVHHTKAKSHTTTTSSVTPTVVEAGLTSVSTKDLRGEQDLALVVAGMVMLMGAGGLSLRLRGAASRI